MVLNVNVLFYRASLRKRARKAYSWSILGSNILVFATILQTSCNDLRWIMWIGRCTVPCVAALTGRLNWADGANWSTNRISYFVDSCIHHAVISRSTSNVSRRWAVNVRSHACRCLENTSAFHTLLALCCCGWLIYLRAYLAGCCCCSAYTWSWYSMRDLSITTTDRYWCDNFRHSPHT